MGGEYSMCFCLLLCLFIISTWFSCHAHAQYIWHAHGFAYSWHLRSFPEEGDRGNLAPPRDLQPWHENLSLRAVSQGWRLDEISKYHLARSRAAKGLAHTVHLFMRILSVHPSSASLVASIQRHGSA